MKIDPESKEFRIHYAKVLLTESAKRRYTGGDYHWFLFNCAQNARRKIQMPKQRELFGGVR